MERVVYVDLFFLINFSMDFLGLFLTAKLLSRKLSLGRGLLGAAIGGLYADLALFLPLRSVAAALLVDACACGLMCALAFGERRRWRELPLYILVYTAISMALGGFMTALFSLLNRSPWFEGVENTSPDGISVWVFALLAGISGLITLLAGRFFVARTAQRNAQLELRYGGKSLMLRAMTDSGNLLCEPISGKPCIVADIGSLRGLLPEEILRAARKGATEIDRVSHRHAGNLRLIPTNTASGQGLLLGVRMERIIVDDGRGAREVDALVALAELGKGADGNEALLPPRLLI